MKCPYCTTENREDRESCYHCGKDISMLRLIVNKARHHYNVALEHAERQRYPEALAELQHCLELDHSFLPAHVVMGTVYAKMEKFNEAERCWQTALSLDPSILKAHDYINKSDRAKRALPLLRQLRFAIVLALALAAVLAMATLWQLRPASHRQDLQKVNAAIEKGHLGEALETAARLETEARSADARQAARLLVLTIEQRFESAAVDMLTLLADGKPVEAHAIFQHLLEGRKIPDRYQRQLEALDRKASDQAIALMGSGERQFAQGTLSYDDLVRQTEHLRQVFAQNADVARMSAKTLAAARQTLVTRTLEQIPASGMSTTDTLVWLARLRDLRSRVPESTDALTSAGKRLVAKAVTQIEEGLKQHLAGQDSAPVLAALDSLQQLAAFQRTESLEALAATAHAALRRMDTDRFKARLAAATVADIREIDQWVAAYETSAVTTLAAEPDTSAALTRARRRLAADMVTWCQERVYRFQKLKMTAEEARLITDSASFTLTYSAAKSWRNTRDLMMFCAAVGWLQLNEKQQAVQWFERLEKDHPQSTYVSTARRYREKAQAELKNQR